MLNVTNSMFLYHYNVGQRLFYSSKVCWFCNHTHKLGNSHLHTLPKNSKKRHWKSSQRGSGCKTKVKICDYFQDSQRQCILLQEQHGLLSLHFYHFMLKIQTAKQNLTGHLFCSGHAGCSFCMSSNQFKLENNCTLGIQKVRSSNQNGPC